MQPQDGEEQYSLSQEQVQEVIKTQEALIDNWRIALVLVDTKPIPRPDNIMQWSEMLASLVLPLKDLLPVLGLYLFITQKQEDVRQILQVVCFFFMIP